MLYGFIRRIDRKMGRNRQIDEGRVRKGCRDE
jgi:hypothetical protein